MLICASPVKVEVTVAAHASPQPKHSRPQDGQQSRDRPTARGTGGGEPDLSALQRRVGNQAVSRWLATSGLASDRDLILLQRDPTAGPKVPGPKAPDPRSDSPQATGSSPISPQKQALIDSKKANAANINLLFDVIQKLRATRVDAWATTAGAKGDKPLRAALEVVIPMLALGSGGVFATLLTGKMAPGLFQEFVHLAGLEAGYIGVEAAYKAAIESSQQALTKGTMATLPSTAKTTDAALTVKGGILEVFVEAAKLQTITEQFEQASEFNASLPSDPSALVDRYLVLEATYKQLLAQPQIFHHVLAAGFMRLLDENGVAEHAAAFGGDLARTRREDTSLESGYLRQGVMRMGPTGGFPGKTAGHSLGSWANPNLAFGDFDGWATGQMNTATLMMMANTPIKDLPLTLDVVFWAKNPYSGWLESPFVTVGFLRSPDGGVQLPRGLSDESKEWLASYHTGTAVEMSKADREKFAPLGAAKLYAATKDKPVAKIVNSDLM